MGRTKSRPVPQSGISSGISSGKSSGKSSVKPQGEQQLSVAAWALIVKTIRELTEAV